MNTPHKHAIPIKAWADGAEIQTRADSKRQWEPVMFPKWDVQFQYRVAPPPPRKMKVYRFLGTMVAPLYKTVKEGSLEHQRVLELPDSWICVATFEEDEQ